MGADARTILTVKTNLLGLSSFFCLGLGLLANAYAQGISPWDQPAAKLADQVVTILGPGQAQLVVNNRSTIAAAELPAIRRLIEQELRARGIQSSGAEGASLIRVTLSENAWKRLWVAEMVEGNQTQVTMVQVDREAVVTSTGETSMVLEKKRIWGSSDTPEIADEPVLAALETPAALILLQQEKIAVLTKTATGWHEENRFDISQRRPLSRDPRGVLEPSSEGSGFTAYVAGTQCIGSYAPPTDAGTAHGELSVRCRASDDPWPLSTGGIATGSVVMKAFYHSSRNFFTGVITPSQGVDLPPFYAAAMLSRTGTGSSHPDGVALLVNSIDGKVRLFDGSALRSVSGTRDWGSDFAAMRTGCGGGIQIVTSGSGETQNESLRVYNLTAQEVVAASAPLEMGGSVTGLWAAPDGAAAWAAVRVSGMGYEVDRVTALCP